LKKLQRENINTTHPDRQNLVDLSSSEEYESINSDKSDNLNNNFVKDNNELDNNEEADSIINHLFVALATTLKDAAIESLKITFSFNSQILVTNDNSTKDLSYVSDREENNKNKSDNEEILIDKKEKKILK
ncbi:26602_t:CDS:2, partial [Gigaspora margarita]